jgi:beta-lactamase superfamily II metal-dependent hydrolase
LAQLDTKNFLFTGDAGVLALNHAIDYADKNGYSLKEKIHYLQIPHHGSKRNLGPSVIERLVGPILPIGTKTEKRAFVSSAVKGHPKHPSPRVMNALTRRGVGVVPTCGTHQCYRSHDVPARDGWGPLTPVDFIDSHDDE